MKKKRFGSASIPQDPTAVETKLCSYYIFIHVPTTGARRHDYNHAVNIFKHFLDH